MLASMCLEQENFDRSQGDFKAALQLLERCPQASPAMSVPAVMPINPHRKTAKLLELCCQVFVTGHCSVC